MHASPDLLSAGSVMTEYSEQEFEAASRLGEILKNKGWLLVTAESCTGGLLAGAITSVSGSSEWYDRGFVTYTNESKIELLDVNEQALQKFGAVSEQVAIEMAEGALTRTITATCAMSTTGIAGPTGGTEGKPVGMVCFALAYRKKDGIVTLPFTRHFSGDRAQVRQQSVLFALTAASRIFEEN